MEKTAILLLQMGGPDSLESVEPFLLNLFRDRDIIKIGPAFLQPFIASKIVKKRAPKSAANYKMIGGKSPLLDITVEQGMNLEKLLGKNFKSYIAMRYWKPFSTETLAEIKKDGIKKIVALSLYPHYSKATSGSSFNDLDRALKSYGNYFEIKYIRHFYDHPLYIKALAEKIEAGLKSFSDPQSTHILFSAHSLPQSFITDGDPYLDQITRSVELVMEHFGAVSYHLAFQSRAGPVKWLEPSTDDKLKELAEKGIKDILIVPISFVSDHIETLHEIDIEYAEKAHHLGITNFRRMDSLNSTPTFIEALAELVKKVTDETYPAV